MYYHNTVSEGSLAVKIFTNKPSIKEMIGYIAGINPDLMDNDREFCYIFDKIALNNGYSSDNLPSYWSIGREIFRYRKENNMITGPKKVQLSYAIKLLDLEKYNCKIKNSNKRKLKMKEIIDVIWNSYIEAFDSDREFVKAYDSIAINNGIEANELPKYWNIIRAGFDYKKDKAEFIKLNTKANSKIKDEEKTPIDYRILDIQIDEIKIEQYLKDALIALNINTIGEFINTTSTFLEENKITKKEQVEIFDALNEYGIKKDVKYISSIMTLPDIFFKKLDEIFDFEIMEILNKYGFKNLGLFVNQFPNFLTNDVDFMKDEKAFEYIYKITKALEEKGIKGCPIQLSYFHKKELYELNIDELLNINYTETLINCLNSAKSILTFEEKVFHNLHYNLSDEMPKAFICDLKNSKKTPYQLLNTTKKRAGLIEETAFIKLQRKFYSEFLETNNYIKTIFNKERNYLILKDIKKLAKYEALLKDILSTSEPSFYKVPFYIDFKLGLIIKKGVSIEDLYNDETTSAKVKTLIEAELFKDYLIIDNEKIKDEPDAILNYFIKAYLKKPVTLSELKAIIKNFKQKGVSYKSVIENKNVIALNYIRYFSKADEIISNINFKKYENSEISALKIFKDNFLLMKKYEIKDEYELYDLLKKNYSKEGLIYLKAPILRFNEGDKEAQVLNLINTLNSTKKEDFINEYKTRYGVELEELSFDAEELINQNLDDKDFDKIDTLMPKAQRDKLAELLTSDFYFFYEIREIYLNLVKGADEKYFNAQSLNKINFNLNSICAYSKKYQSILAYIRRLLANNVINLNLKQRFYAIDIFYYCLKNMIKDFDIIEFAPEKYVHYNKLNQAGIIKKDFINYQKEALEFAGGEFFTIYSLRKNGFRFNKLDDLGFENYFYSSILINGQNISYKNLSGVYLMKEAGGSFIFADFIAYLIQKFNLTNVFSLSNFIKTNYGINISASEIMDIIPDCRFYYQKHDNSIKLRGEI